MNVADVQLLFDYGYWARDRLLAASAGLDEDAYAAPNGFTYGSLRSVLTHTLAAEARYVARWRGETSAEIRESDVPTIEALTIRWQEQERHLKMFLAGLTDDAINRDLVSRARDGGEFHRPLALDMFQIANHGMQHRSEVAEALTRIGRSPGDLDFSLYLQQADRPDVTGGRP